MRTNLPGFFVSAWILALFSPVTLFSPAVQALEITRTDHSGADLVQAQVQLPVTPSRLLPVLEQPCHVRQWMPDLVRIQLLATDGKPGQRVYMVSRGSWLTRPRDSVSRFVRSGSNPIVITMTAEPDALPQRDQYIRIPFARARWSLLRREDTTLLQYQQQVAAGGSIPQWLADQYSVRFVRHAMEALTKYVATLSSADCPAEP